MLWWTPAERRDQLARTEWVVALDTKRQLLDEPRDPIPGESRRGLGIACEPSTPSIRAEKIAQQIKELTEPDSPEAFKAKQVMELLDFEETHGNRDLIHWIKYVIKFGHMHLVNPHHRVSYKCIYDLDIKFLLLFSVYAAYSSVRFAILMALNYAKKKKN